MADAGVTLAVRRIRLELLLQKFGPRATVAAMPFATVVWMLFYLHRPAPSALANAGAVASAMAGSVCDRRLRDASAAGPGNV